MSVVSCSTTSTTAYKVTADTTGTLVLQTGATPTTAVTIDGSQNVSINGASAFAKLSVLTSGAGNDALNVQSSDSVATIQMRSSTGAYIGIPQSAYLAFGTNNTERARIDSSGNLLVGTTSSYTNGGITISPSFTGASQSGIGIGHITGTTSGQQFIQFAYGGSAIGSITQNGTTGVLYNLTSDYRLKNDPQPLTGAKEFVMALQPKKWQWWDGSGEGVGFIAHEFMEVAKYSGNGEKDAVDEEGKIIAQSIQPSSSEVMANLVAFIQELKAELDAAKADIATLKGAA